jgi:hypothetical protein
LTPNCVSSGRLIEESKGGFQESKAAVSFAWVEAQAAADRGWASADIPELCSVLGSENEFVALA